jgi:predicted Zn-dependent peptidase
MSASTRITKLDNGLTVITERMPELQTASLGIWVGAGARYEEESENGISHLLEHMAFKGTTHRTPLQIAEEIENVGGDLNASTGLETTGYYSRVLGDDVPLALDILTDILTTPTFADEELVREQGVILQEIGASYDAPEDLVYQLFQKCAFPDQPIGRPILGTPDSVKSQSPESLRDYMGKHYRGSRMVLGAAGAVDHDRIVEDVTKRLAPIPSAAAEPAKPARYTGGKVTETSDLEQVHVMLGLEGRSYHAPDYFPLQIFTNVLGGGSSSRLFQEVREKRGLCYSIYAHHASYSDTGIFAVYAGTDPGDSPDLMKVVIEQLNEAAEKASPAEVARAKAMMKVGLLTALESSGARADQLARHIIAYGRPIPMEELVQRIDAVTVEDVRAAGRKLIAAGRPAFAGLGPNTGIESAARIAESLVSKAA